jgi:hypothetical protein
MNSSKDVCHTSHLAFPDEKGKQAARASSWWASDKGINDNQLRNTRSVAMANRFFQKIASDVLEASEKLSARLEDGISAILTGELTASGQPDDPNRVLRRQEDNEGLASSASSGDVGGESDFSSSQAFEETIEMLEGEDAYGGTPLEGIARGVIGDIMANQVRPVPAPGATATAAPRISSCSSYNLVSLCGFFVSSG